VKVGFLQGVISTGKLIINGEVENPLWSAFLIDLDLAIEKQQERPSGARGKTGTRAFMAIGLLLGEQHLFRHDLESFFGCFSGYVFTTTAQAKRLGQLTSTVGTMRMTENPLVQPRYSCR
jgi:hypothetical protein